MEIIKLRIKNNIPLVEFWYNGNKLLGIIDTACSHTMLCETKVAKELIVKETTTTKGFAGESETMLADIKQIVFGNTIIKDLCVTVCEEKQMLEISRMINEDIQPFERIHAVIGNDILIDELEAVINLKSNNLLIQK